MAEKDLPARLQAAELTVIHPLRMVAVGADGKKVAASAFNEVSLLRQRHQAAKIAIAIDGKPVKGATATSYCWLVWIHDQTDTRLRWLAECRERLERPEDALIGVAA